MTEHKLLRALMVLLRMEVERHRNGVVIKHADGMTSGVPDFTVTWNKLTSWYEVKYAKLTIKSMNGLQLLTAKRLAHNGQCYFIVYQEITQTGKRVCLVKPSEVSMNGTFTCPTDRIFPVPRFKDAHAFVVKFILQVHGEIDVTQHNQPLLVH